MNTLQRGILLLVKSAITGEAYALPEDFSLESALPVIKKHQLTTLAYQGGSNCGLDGMSPAMLPLLQGYCGHMMRSEGQIAQIQRLCAAFEAHGIDYMPLKGCNMKSRYPKPELRVMGDADILIRMEQYDAICPVMEELGFEQVTENDHEWVWDSAALHLELHKRLIPSYNRDYYAYYGDGWQLAKRREGFRHAMTPEDEFIYNFTHFAKHYRDAGIGCRHVLDLWVYLRACPGLDMDYICAELEKLRLLEFYGNVRRLLEFWFEGGSGDEKTALMTDFIWDSGTWGTWKSRILSMEVKNRKMAGSVQGGKFLALRRMLFPTVESMTNLYPFLKKAPWLTPVMWPVRWIATPLFRWRSIQKKQQDIRTASTEKVDDYQRAMNYVGLDFNFGE